MANSSYQSLIILQNIAQQWKRYVLSYNASLLTTLNCQLSRHFFLPHKWRWIKILREFQDTRFLILLEMFLSNFIRINIGSLIERIQNKNHSSNTNKIFHKLRLSAIIFISPTLISAISFLGPLSEQLGHHKSLLVMWRFSFEAAITDIMVWKRFQCLPGQVKHQKIDKRNGVKFFESKLHPDG